MFCFISTAPCGRVAPSHVCGWNQREQHTILATKTNEPAPLCRITCAFQTSISRRGLMRWAVAVLGGSMYSIDQAPRAEAVYNPFGPPPDLVMRLKQRTPEEMAERLFQEDLHYPEFFAGKWKSISTLLSVACPAGYKLFGRTGAFEEAKKGIGRELEKNCSMRVDLYDLVGM
eukprot:gb/GEZJ01005840.1/.p1 GENE.gb/GEZJ01005840.1/~~gb/GEZJ01005840.1/.p1  ORF type:complete len:173 (-),score=16.79 gb/GEZJ01005840.1/:375-893(-)